MQDCRAVLKKGAKVYLEGQLQTRKWQDKDGKDRYSTEVVLQNFNSTLTMLDGKTSGGSFGAEEEAAILDRQGLRVRRRRAAWQPEVAAATI